MHFLTGEDILFHGFAVLAVVSALLVVFLGNPIYSALFLALCLCVLGALFFVLQAYFVAVAQITVYAGAVMVLFVMVVMLFDLRKEHEDILKFSPVTGAKILATALLCGFLVGTGWLAVSAISSNPATTVSPQTTVAAIDKKNLPLPPPSAASTTDAAAENVKAGEVTSANTNPDEDLSAAEAAKLVEKNSGASKTTTNEAVISQEEFGSTTSLSRRLFSKYVFAFEAVSLLLLVVIVGAVALAKSRGGTHHVAR